VYIANHIGAGYTQAPILSVHWRRLSPASRRHPCWSRGCRWPGSQLEGEPPEASRPAAPPWI